MESNFDCTLYCGYPMDGKLCNECKVAVIWERTDSPSREEMRVQVERWTGGFTEEGAPRWRQR